MGTTDGRAVFICLCGKFLKTQCLNQSKFLPQAKPWYPITVQHPERYVVDYWKLFIETVGETVRAA